MEWTEIKTFKQLAKLNNSWIVVATLTHYGVLYNSAIYGPKNKLFINRAKQDCKIGARTIVLQIPEPKAKR